MVIKNLEDVTRELRAVKDELDRLRSLNLDMSGRRVINAGRAISNSDYITYGHVLELLGSGDKRQKIEPGILQIDFTVGVPEIGDDVAVRPVVYLPYNEKAVPVLCGARLRTAPSGGAFKLRWNHYSKYNDNTVDLFNGVELTIADGDNYSTITKFYPNRNIATQDYFTLDITAVNDGAGLYTFLAVLVN